MLKSRSSEFGKVVSQNVPDAPRCLWRSISRRLTFTGRYNLALLRDRWTLTRSGLFDARWYLAQNPDVAASGTDPVLHYLLHGAYEGRQPNRVFDSQWYLAENPDVASAGVNPLLHYIRRGWQEERCPARGFDSGSYIAQNPGLKGQADRAFAHYVQHAKRPDSDGEENVHTPMTGISGPIEPKRDLLELVRRYRANRDTRKASVVVYTVITGNSDVLKIPEALCFEWDYVCFTDRAEIAGEHPWQIRPADYIDVNPSKTALYYQCMPHRYVSEYEVSIWLDPTILLRSSCLEPMVSAFSSSSHSLAVLCEGARSEEPTSKNAVEAVPKVMIRKHALRESVQFGQEWWSRECASAGDAGAELSNTLSLLKPSWMSLEEQKLLTSDGRNLVLLPPTKQSANTSSPYIVPAFLPSYYTDDVRPYWSIQPGKKDPSLAAEWRDEAIDVVVCCHNAPEDEKRCLESLLATLPQTSRVILIDDGSGSQTQELLRGFAQNDRRIDLIRNESPIGYTRSANIGLRRSSADFVVLLNSDTIVCGNWAKKLASVARSAPNIGIVGPLSNAASWQTVPVLFDADKSAFLVNELPSGVTVDHMDQLCEQLGSVEYFPKVSLINGFCYGIKREVFDAIGYLDEEAFPIGYGEEDDFSLRAIEAGFIHAIATNTFVFHAKSKSFGDEKRKQLSQAGAKTLQARHGTTRIRHAVSVMREQPVLASLRHELCQRLEGSTSSSPISLPAGPIVKREEQLASDREGLSSPASMRARTRKFPDIFPHELTLARVTIEELRANEQMVKEMRGRTFQPPVQIVWFLPRFGNLLAGGIRTLFMFAEEFSRRWGTHNHFALVQTLGATPTLDRAQISTLFPRLKFSADYVDVDFDPDRIPECDFAICSSWPTAYSLLRFNRCKAKFYFMQDYESLFYPAGSVQGMIDLTYQFGFFCIANSEGIAQKYRPFSSAVEHFAPGIDTNVFRPREKLRTEPPYQVVFYGRPKNHRNGFALGTEALRIVKKECGSRVNIVSAGAEWNPADYGLENVMTNLGVLRSLDQVAQLYRKSDVGLIIMMTPHPSYQPLEFMASGCATVTNSNYGANWLFQHERNAFVTPIAPVTLAEGIVTLIEDEALRRRIVEGGFETARRFRWHDAFERICSFVLDPERASDHRARTNDKTPSNDGVAMAETA